MPLFLDFKSVAQAVPVCRATRSCLHGPHHTPSLFQQSRCLVCNKFAEVAKRQAQSLHALHTPLSRFSLCPGLNPAWPWAAEAFMAMKRFHLLPIPLPSPSLSHLPTLLTY